MRFIETFSVRRQAPRRLGNCDGVLRRAIAMFALALGIILGTSEPEYLLALIPLEALLAFELIFWNDRSIQCEHSKSPAENKPESKFGGLNEHGKS
jgi:hypothetical protein